MRAIVVDLHLVWTWHILPNISFTRSSEIEVPAQYSGHCTSLLFSPEGNGQWLSHNVAEPRYRLETITHRTGGTVSEVQTDTLSWKFCHILWFNVVSEKMPKILDFEGSRKPILEAICFNFVNFVVVRQDDFDEFFPILISYCKIKSSSPGNSQSKITLAWSRFLGFRR